MILTSGSEGQQRARPQLRYSLFKSRYQTMWHKCLPFRSRSEFPECDECYQLKEALRTTKDLWQFKYMTFRAQYVVCGTQDLQLKLQHLQDYRDHLAAVAKDRQLECRSQSEDVWGGSQKPVLFLQTDGMDQAKWALPRLSKLTQSKRMSGVVR